MSALETLLAGLPLAGEAGDVAEVLAHLAVTGAPHQVSLRLSVNRGLVNVRVRAGAPTRPFAEREPGAYVRDLVTVHDLADRWGHAARSTGQTLWWARIGDEPRIGGA